MNDYLDNLWTCLWALRWHLLLILTVTFGVCWIVDRIERQERQDD